MAVRIVEKVGGFGGVLAVCGMLAGCQPAAEPTAGYGAPGASGLVAVRGYPGEGDVCQVIGENALTSEFLGDASLLIGCPASEPAEIESQLSNGGRRLEQVGDWVLISVPLR